MLYRFAHIVQAKLPWLWECVEEVNAALFYTKVKNKWACLNRIFPSGVRMLDPSDAIALAAFFANQPKESFHWFRPHAFDETTLRKLLKRKSYLMYVQEEGGVIIGYAFLRCFFHGKCFLGKMVDANHQGKGVCTNLCAVGMDIADTLGLRMFESINKENVGSMKASQKACEVIIVEELEGGDILIEDRKRKT